ncbi:MAG TPA: hypothetical protein VIW24_32080 [Aldersonia sp.]
MTEPDEAESSQISVAELLARNGRQVGDRSGGRRRRGTSGGISVAELTGELPVRSRAAGEQASEVPEPAPDESEKPKVPDVPEPAPDTSEVPEPAPDEPEKPEVPDVPEATPDTTEVPEPAPDEPEKPKVPEAARASSESGRATGTREESGDPSVASAPESEAPSVAIGDSGDPSVAVTAAAPAVDANAPGPAKQWLSLIGQAVVALAVGALLFVGFERLWDDLPWIALVMAILVILGLVAVSRVLRRSDDTLGVMIAVGVGLFVTMGPLALVLSQR